MTNETDNRFKTALDGLPDAPPPGTAFDADALWADLDRQLRPRRRFAGWWVAACGVLTLLAGLGGGVLFLAEKTTPSATRLAAEPARREGKRAVSPEKEGFKNAPVASRAVSPPKRATPQRGTTPVVPVPPAPAAALAEEASPAGPETAVAMSPPAPTEAADSMAASSLAAKPVFLTQKPARPKPRFRVVHAHELPSSETIPTKQPRAEATARVTIGFDAALQAAPADPLPVLILTKKPD